MPKNVTISVVVPVFNSEKILPELSQRLVSILQEICEQEYEVILVDDCSADNAWTKIKELSASNTNIKGIRLGKNFGQWMASLAGMSQSSGKYIVTIDDDLEYDPVDIKKMYSTIQSEHLYLVFGVSSKKYAIRSTNARAAQLRFNIVNLIWNKFPTDSFKIFTREVVFQNNQFTPRLHFEAFVKHSLDKRFVGYTEVNYSKRNEGTSNHSLWKKTIIFLRYSMEYYRFPAVPVSIFSLSLICSSFLFETMVWKTEFPHFAIAISIFLAIPLLLFIFAYVSAVYRTERNVSDYWIIEKTASSTSSKQR